MQDRREGPRPGNWIQDLYGRWPRAQTFNRILAVLLFSFPVVLWVLPIDFFDDEGGPALCPSKFLLNVECPGCGLTRAVMHMHHLDMAGALYYHTGIVIVYPMLLGLWAWMLYRALRMAF